MSQQSNLEALVLVAAVFRFGPAWVSVARSARSAARSQLAAWFRLNKCMGLSGQRNAMLTARALYPRGQPNETGPRL